jgi:hypothetical protein
MKYVWEAEDIVGKRIASLSKRPDIKVMIFYDEAMRDSKIDTRWGLISLDDGMVIVRGMTPALLGIWMTNYGYKPEELL